MGNDVTLDDVARLSGVSRATASRALNGRDGVRDDVRERVMTVAKGLDYRPNRAAKNLAGGRTSVIGLIVGSELPVDAYAVALVHAVARSADQHDEGLMLIMDSSQPNVAVRKLISDGLIDGVIVSAVAIGQRWIEELLDAQVPTVLVGGHPRRSDVHVIDTENMESSAQLVGMMLDAGARRLGTITGPLDRVDASLRLQGFRLAHERRNLDVNEDLIVSGDFSRERSYGLADSLLDLKPDGVFAANDETAVGLLRRARERGIDVPGEVKIAGFDGIVKSDVTGLTLTTVCQPFEQLAETAVKTLVGLVNSEPMPLEQLVHPELTPGETVIDSSTSP